MELRHLRYFVAVADALSFTKAARNLRLAQPSLTRQVRNLEGEIGVRLLDRSKVQIALTNEGRAFLADAKKILTACAESVAAVQEIGRSERRRLNIGYIANIHHSLLPVTLAAYRKLYPQVALNLFDLTRAEQFEALKGRMIDLGFVGSSPSPAELNQDENRFKCIAYDTIQVAVGQEYPLHPKRKLELADLASQFFICLSGKIDPGDCEWVKRVCRQAGFTARILQEAADGPAAIRFVRDGLGVALLPSQMAELPHEGVRFVSLAPPLRRESAIAWRSDNTAGTLADYIVIAEELTRSM